jgi:hypothetical protein
VRHHDWPERLASFIETRRETPFAYGTHDCCAFAGAVAEAITGTNPAAPFPYDSQVGALRLIAEHGGLDKLLTAALGEPVPPAMAGRGDIVLADLEGGPTAGVCIGRDCAFPADVGVTFRSRAVVGMAWKVE